MNTMAMAKRLRDLRGYTPRRVVAENIGVSEASITAYEMGERVPRDAIKRKLADYYNTTVEAIFFSE